MSDDLTLEVELDLPLEAVDVAAYRTYIANGMSERNAAVQVAQDILGAQGVEVQYAQAVRT